MLGKNPYGIISPKRLRADIRVLVGNLTNAEASTMM